MNVDTGGIVEPAILLGDADDLVTVLHHQPGCIGAHIAESLNNDATALNGHVEITKALAAHHLHASPCGLHTAARTTDIQRLAGYDAGDGMTPCCMEYVSMIQAMVLLVGIYVRSGNTSFSGPIKSMISAV